MSISQVGFPPPHPLEEKQQEPHSSCHWSVVWTHTSVWFSILGHGCLNYTLLLKRRSRRAQQIRRLFGCFWSKQGHIWAFFPVRVVCIRGFIRAFTPPDNHYILCCISEIQHNNSGEIQDCSERSIFSNSIHLSKFMLVVSNRKSNYYIKLVVT